MSYRKSLSRSPFPRRSVLTRRGLLRAAGSGAGALVLGAGTGAGDGAAGGGAAAFAADALFGVPLRVARTLRAHPRRTGKGVEYDLYRLVTRESTTTIVPGTTTRLRTFNGEPVPVIRATQGRPVVIQQVNQLDVPFAMHLHGGHVAAHYDGHPVNELAPGASRFFQYPNKQRASSMWLHDHSHHAHAENIYRGAVAGYLLTDDFERKLPLPKGAYDVLLHLRDANVAPDGTLVYEQTGGAAARTVFLVNGSPRPYFRVAARKYRFRFTNTSNERGFLLQLGDGDEMTHIASDGGLLPAPVKTGSLWLWPAERQEVVVDFSRYPVGSKVVLKTLATNGDEPPEIMRFDVARRAADASSVPDELRPNPALGAPAVERSFTMSFDPAAGHHLINGKHFDPGRVEFRPKLGTTEIWTIHNADTGFGIPHSFHVHLEHFQVVDRDGRAPGPGEAGLKDTITVLPGTKARVKVRFTDYKGRFMYHCHMMGHLTMGMMGQMEVVD
ncbi:multicopper oxidase family protein [Streptomyces sp. NPDC050504]|uniref:multicopper oxidase family protein n=1 Tax=Streptomyces sp. NPDC050504 TaxID=3365618 RepID=UPI0037B6DCAE